MREYIKEHWQDFSDLLRIKTIAAQHIGIEETSTWVAQAFRNLGAKKVAVWDDQGGNPVVFAEFTGQSDKTILFYNHYDTQPAEPLDQWATDPFAVTVQDDHIFARGIGDDKGDLIFRLAWVKYHQERGDLPVNVKFYVEGEEEIGSSHVVQYTQAHQADLQADAVLWEGGAKNEAEKLAIVGGLRGISCLELTAVSADVDLHSSKASYAESAPWRLVKALNLLRDDQTSRILIPGIYDDVRPLTPAEQQQVATLDFDAAKVIAGEGLKRPLLTDTPRTDLTNQPTITINGITAGYQEEGVKTVLPRLATAKLDFRLAPDQDPQRIPDLVRAYLDQNGFTDIKVEYIVGQKGYRSDVNHPFVGLVCDTAREVYGPDGYQYVLNSFGAGPAYAFGDLLQLPVLGIGIGYAGSNVHGANENVRLTDALQAVEHLELVAQKFAQK